SSGSGGISGGNVSTAAFAENALEAEQLQQDANKGVGEGGANAVTNDKEPANATPEENPLLQGKQDKGTTRGFSTLDGLDASGQLVPMGEMGKFVLGSPALEGGASAAANLPTGV